VIENKNHNRIHFFTTLSVYIGLVIVGASPQVLADSKTTYNSHAPSFEIHAKRNSVISKFTFKSEFKSQNISPFSVFTALSKDSFKSEILQTADHFSNLYAQVSAENDQVSVVTNFPRAAL